MVPLEPNIFPGSVQLACECIHIHLLAYMPRATGIAHPTRYTLWYNRVFRGCWAHIHTACWLKCLFFTLHTNYFLGRIRQENTQMYTCLKEWGGKAARKNKQKQIKKSNRKSVFLRLMHWSNWKLSFQSISEESEETLFRVIFYTAQNQQCLRAVISEKVVREWMGGDRDCFSF